MPAIRAGSPTPKTAHSSQQRNDPLRIHYPSVCFQEYTFVGSNFSPILAQPRLYTQNPGCTGSVSGTVQIPASFFTPFHPYVTYSNTTMTNTTPLPSSQVLLLNSLSALP